jgi:hypothetical protein
VEAGVDKSVAEILANVDLYAEDQREHLLEALAWCAGNVRGSR